MCLWESSLLFTPKSGLTLIAHGTVPLHLSKEVLSGIITSACFEKWGYIDCVPNNSRPLTEGDAQWDNHWCNFHKGGQTRPHIAS